MPAPKGNHYWEPRKKHGNNKTYKPDELWEAACTYFQWCEDNPWTQAIPVKAGPQFGQTVTASTPRPFTLKALCIHLGITFQTFLNYETDNEYSDTCSNIKDIISNQKFEGAAVGIFNSSIIARDLGLTDKREHGNSKGKPFRVESAWEIHPIAVHPRQ